MPVVDIGRLRKRLLLGQQLTGIDRVTLEYLGWAQSRGHRCCVKVGRHLRVLPHDHAEVILQQATSQWSPDSQSSKLPPWRLRLADTVLGLRNERVRDALVINTSQSWLQEAAVWQGLKTDGNRVVCFVHDLIPITHPQYNREHARPLHEARLRMALRHAAGVIVNSRHTLETLDHWAKGEGVGLPPTVVLPLGVSDPVRPASPPQAMEPSFVVLGTIEPRKNHLLLLRIWKRLVETGCTPMPRLVIVGKIGWDADPVTEYLADCTQIAPFVELRSSASDQAVRALLTQATALLFPSFAEGYGLPLVEALACGTPVIASPLPAFREIAGEVPDYVDPNDEAGWEARIRGFLNDETGLLRDARARLTDYHPRDWIRHFADLEAFLEGLG